MRVNFMDKWAGIDSASVSGAGYYFSTQPTLSARSKVTPRERSDARRVFLFSYKSRACTLLHTSLGAILRARSADETHHRTYKQTVVCLSVCLSVGWWGCVLNIVDRRILLFL